MCGIYILLVWLLGKFSFVCCGVEMQREVIVSYKTLNFEAKRFEFESS